MSDTPKTPWAYNVDKMRARLIAIRERYYRPVIAYPEGPLNHHGDCETHRAMDVYKYAPCTCGLLHDLKVISHDMAVKIFPPMEDDMAKQDAMIPGHRYWRGPATEEEKLKCEEFMQKHFGKYKAVGPSPEEWEEITARDWSLIEEVFGQPFRQRMEAEWKSKDEIE
jgi:hypothetical protein